MKFSAFATIVAAATAVFASTGDASDTVNWSYKANAHGVTSPTQWGTNNPTCGGRRQSPIDIPAQTLAPSNGPVPLVFAGSCPEFNVTQNYDGFKATVASGGACTVTRNSKDFKFAQVHFHSPSEHTIDGKAMDGVAHFVHQAGDGSIVVVGLFLEASGTSDPFVAQFVRSIQGVTDTQPAIANLGSFHTTVRKGLGSGRAFNYPGSLTTPGCSEIVDWWVVEKPVGVSSADLAALRTHFRRIASADNGKTARPTQPLNGRAVTMYATGETSFGFL